MIVPIYILATSSAPLPGCQTFDGLDSCQGSNIDVDSSANNRTWQTPPKGSANYLPSYQSYRELTGNCHVEYAGGNVKVNVKAVSRTNSALEFSYDGGATFSQSSTFTTDQSTKSSLSIVVRDSIGNTLKFDPIDLIWNNAPIRDKPQFRNGQMGAIVDLFGWKWKDVEKECSMLAQAGYMGVKINPPNEHLITSKWLDNNFLNPWYFIYQPVSYRLESRGGSRNELRSMIQTCRSLGVRVYADAVINHMTGGANDILDHRRQVNGNCIQWGPKNSTGGSPFFTYSNTYEPNPYTNARPGLEYPAVPWNPSDFHCNRPLSSFTDPLQLDAGWLVGLADLNTGRDNVQERIADYLTDLIGIGFSGFRIDAAKHIAPASLAKIISKLRRNLGGNLPADFITWLEVIIGGEKDLLACKESPYNYYTGLDAALKAEGLNDVDINKIKIWSSDYPKEMPICGTWILPASRFVIQNDDHDQQNPGSSSRDMGDKGSVLIKEKDAEKHRGFEVQLFERRDADWAIKVVLSSYSYGPKGENGFLDGLSDCSTYTGSYSGCLGAPKVNAYDANSCGYSSFQKGQLLPFSFTRVHRDRSIIMAMRKWVGLPVSDDLGIPKSCQ